jgi:hypothetical protein
MYVRIRFKKDKHPPDKRRRDNTDGCRKIRGIERKRL